jgi:hypothetical protein
LFGFAAVLVHKIPQEKNGGMIEQKCSIMPPWFYGSRRHVTMEGSRELHPVL